MSRACKPCGDAPLTLCQHWGEGWRDIAFWSMGITLSACGERWWTGAADERDCAPCPPPPADLGRLLLDALDSGGSDARITAHTARDGHTLLAERQYLVEWCGCPVYHGTDLVEALSRLVEATRPPPLPPTLCALETA